jgi:alpha-tubulin suppressor-like RCC1 family protein
VHLSTSDPECALDAEGRAWRWPKGTLELDPANVKGAKAISCSRSHTCVVAEDATAMCWGDNTYGALGDGTEKNSPTPVKVTGLASVAEIHADFSRTCARTTTGDVYCWGDREFGKAGDGTMIDNKGREKTTAGKSIASGTTSLGVSMIHACAAHGDGSVSCWGQCRSGACGQPPKPPWVIRPMKAPKVKDVATLVAGENATCGLDKAGGLFCWGLSTNGILGTSVTDNKAHDTPVKIDLPGPAAEVAIGIGGHACARLATGAVHCWGKNEHGQLGDGTTKDRSAAAPVKGLENATRIAAGLETSCAIAEGGRLFCWGDRHKPQPVEILPAK